MLATVFIALGAYAPQAQLDPNATDSTGGANPGGLSAAPHSCNTCLEEHCGRRYVDACLACSRMLCSSPCMSRHRQGYCGAPIARDQAAHNTTTTAAPQATPQPMSQIPPVAFLFLTTETLPLAPAWRTFFDGCPAGSYTVHIHAQRLGAAPPPELPEANMVANPTQGELRFRYSMQEAMLKLYRNAAGATAPNGRRPIWAQMLSDSCAPVVSCTRYHDILKMRAGQSLFKGGAAGGWYASPAHWPAGFKTTRWFWQSQWCTLWMDHARQLLRHEQENYRMWQNAGTPDEYYSVNVLTVLGANITVDAGLTKISHGYEVKPRGKGSGGQPGLITCSTTGVSLLYVDSENYDTPSTAMHLHQVDLVQARAELEAQMGSAQLYLEKSSERMPTPPRISLADIPPAARAEFDRLIDDAAAEGHAFARKFAPACVDLISAKLRQEP